LKSIAGITCHPQSSSGVVPAYAKQDDQLSPNKSDPRIEKRVTGFEPATFSLGSFSIDWPNCKRCGESHKPEVGAFYWTDAAPDIVNPGRVEQGSASV
jgi:hypothetical protein